MGWQPKIALFVPGIPKPGGSKRAFYIPKLKRAIITDACKDSKDWKRTVSTFAAAAYTGPLIDEPMFVRFIFYVTRPRSHYGSGRNSGVLKPSAPRFPAVMPDVTKLVRSTEDACTGILWRDDSRIVIQNAMKVYSDKPGAEIIVLIWGEA